MKSKVFKFILVCIICIGSIAGIVWLIEYFSK